MSGWAGPAATRVVRGGYDWRGAIQRVLLRLGPRRRRVSYDHDLIIDRGAIRKRKKAASRKFRDAYGHTPLSAGQDIPGDAAGW